MALSIRIVSRIKLSESFEMLSNRLYRRLSVKNQVRSDEIFWTGLVTAIGEAPVMPGCQTMTSAACNFSPLGDVNLTTPQSRRSAAALAELVVIWLPTSL
jgi:hypothetical protein